jgi:glycolate oxidase FAD binding subunit
MIDTIHRPADEAGVISVVAAAHAARTPLEVLGGGSKRRVGRAMQTAATLDVSALTGVTLYEPAEMVIAARAGTPVADLVATLDAKGQMLPFEPMDWRALMGTPDAVPTLGGLVAGNVSGPRRVAVGACRDHLIGVRFVNGRGEAIKSGGRVMKNVTGYDLVKLLAGSWGTLGVLTEVTFKVLPKPETEATLVFSGLPFRRAVELMSAALGSPFEVSGAAFVPAIHTGDVEQTCLRIENFAASVAYRTERLSDLLSGFGTPWIAGVEDSRRLWADIRDVKSLADDPDLSVIRISVAPSKAADILDVAIGAGARAGIGDWGGGLMWLGCAVAQTATVLQAVQTALARTGGHATLVRAGDAPRRDLSVFQPEAAPLAAMTRKVKAALDPAGVLNPGRMFAGV